MTLSHMTLSHMTRWRGSEIRCSDLRVASPPLTASRGAFRFLCRSVIAALGRAYFFCMGFRVVVKGQQVSSGEAPVIVVAPHSTFFDGIVCIVAGLPSIVSRVENLATPIFGREILAVCVCVCVCPVCVFVSCVSVGVGVSSYLQTCHLSVKFTVLNSK